MPKGMVLNGRFVGKWRWDDKAGTEQFTFSTKAHRDAFEVAGGIAERAAAIKANRDLSQSGRQKALNALAQSEAAKLRGAVDALGKTADWLARKRSSLAPAKADRTDVVGGLIRQELRTHLRSMDPSKKAAMLVMGVDPEIALAISEAPAFLSGVTEAQKAGLADQALIAAHPEAFREFAEVTEAAGIAGNTINVALSAVAENTGFSAFELRKQLGDTSRIASFLTGVLSTEPEAAE